MIVWDLVGFLGLMRAPFPASGQMAVPLGLPSHRAVALAMLLLATGCAGSPTGDADPSPLATRADAYFRPFVERGLFSGVVLIGDDRSIHLLRTYGYEDFEQQTPTSPGSRYRLASLAKSFTAAAVLALRDERKVRLEDPLSRFLPTFPNGAQITIEQLLTHRSGVGAFEDPQVYLRGGSLELLVDAVAASDPMFAPGQGEAYSNEGYVLLARVVEVASGETWPEYVTRAWIEPLGMARSGVESAVLPADRAKGHRATLGSAPQRVTPDSAPLPGASGMYGSAEDLLSWLRSVRAAGTFQRAGYPYGWGRRTYDGQSLLEQSGMVEGYSTYMAMYDDGPFVIVLSNVQSGMQASFGPDMAAVLGGRTPSRPPDLTAIPAPADAGEFVGAYDLEGVAYPFRIRVGETGLESTWGPFPFWRPVTFIASDQLIVPADFTRLTPRRDTAGRLTGLLMQRLHDGTPVPGSDAELARKP